MNMRQKLNKTIARIPVIGTVSRRLTSRYHTWNFPGSANYWEEHYRRGGNSGPGSYDQMAMFKAQVLNSFVVDNQIQTVIEFGCGDGNQLSLANYQGYIGLDVSLKAIELCKARFNADTSKSFFLYHSFGFQDHHRIFRAELALSLEVIFHITEDTVYENYMSHLFGAAERYVIIFSSNFNSSQSVHMRHHCFTDWVTQHCTDWRLKQKIDHPNPYNPNAPLNTAIGDFYIFEKV